MSIGKGNSKQLKSGDSPWTGPLNAAIWNEVVETTQAVRGSRGLGIMNQGGEMHSRLMVAAKNCTIGIIDDTDRTAEGWPDFTADNRYWLKVWTMKARAAGSPAAVTEIENLDATTAMDLIVPATNLAERNPNDTSGGSHLLQNGTIVLLWEIVIGDNTHWVFWQVPLRSGFWCQLGPTATPIDEYGDDVPGTPAPCDQYRWRYSGTEGRRSEKGWVAVLGDDGGRVVDVALNATEAPNDGTGTEGHGVDVTACAATPEVYTLPANTGQPIVWMRMEADADGITRYTFEFQNALKVTC